MKLAFFLVPTNTLLTPIFELLTLLFSQQQWQQQ